MARYRRQHSGPNLSTGMMWVLAICAIAYMVYKINSCRQRIEATWKMERELQDTSAPVYRLVTDTLIQH